MSEPVNLDLWQERQAATTVNLDLGAIDLTVIALAEMNAISIKAKVEVLSEYRFIVSADVRSNANVSLITKYIDNGYIQAECSTSDITLSSVYDINVYRGPSSSNDDQWSRIGRNESANTPIIWEQSQKTNSESALKQTSLNQLTNESIESSSEIIFHANEINIEHLELDKSSVFNQQSFVDLRDFRNETSIFHSDALKRHSQSSSNYHPSLPKAYSAFNSIFVRALTSSANLLNHSIKKGSVSHKDFLSLYEEAIYARYGVSNHDDGGSNIDPRTGPVNLNFIRPFLSSPNLEFYWDGKSGIIIPTRRVYLVSNHVAVLRVSDNSNIPVTGVSVEYDEDSWAWQFSASIPKIAIAESLWGSTIKIIMNGYEWVMSVDGWSDSSSWGSESATITGRSQTKDISDSVLLPVSRNQTQDNTIIQLAELELPYGWSLDWSAADWLVPANSWSYSNKVPITVIQELANAAGGFLLPSQTQKSISVMPRYQTLPWELESAIADIEIPKSIMINRGRQLTEGTNANAIWVAGETNGISALVKRAGSGADRLLSTVVNPLITHIDGARSFGANAIADSMTKSIDTIELPITSETGLILPGKLVKTPDGKCYPRSFKATAQLNDRKLTVRQTIELQRVMVS